MKSVSSAIQDNTGVLGIFMFKTASSAWQTALLTHRAFLRPEPQELAFSSRLNFVARFVLCECKMPYFSQVKKTGIVSETLVKYLL
ncbi:MAG: hypothetical protein MUD08_04985 [Cytophagales bacterium]|nr:hypothetical protein [Cytophagales bacterium]